MTADLAAETAFDSGDVLNVIDVAVGQEQQREIGLLGFKPFAGALGRIKQDWAVRHPDEVTVCLEDAAAKRVVFHASTLRYCSRPSQLTVSGIYLWRPKGNPGERF